MPPALAGGFLATGPPGKSKGEVLILVVQLPGSTDLGFSASASALTQLPPEAAQDVWELAGEGGAVWGGEAVMVYMCNDSTGCRGLYQPGYLQTPCTGRPAFWGSMRSGEGRGGWPWGPGLYMESPAGIQLASESVLKVDSNGNPLQYSCLGNPMDRGAWMAVVHGFAKESDMTY